MSSQPEHNNTNPVYSAYEKQTLIKIIDFLAQLKAKSASQVEQLATVDHDEQLQAFGADMFHKFERQLRDLDKELRNFANDSRQLSSSIGLLSSASELRKRLSKVLYLFHSNAASIFPQKISKKEQPRTISAIPPRRARTSPQFVNIDNLDVEELPTELKLLATDAKTFLECLHVFPDSEFTDEETRASIEAFRQDLEYWAHSLEKYKGQFSLPVVQRYIHDLSAELGEHIDNITYTIRRFIESGIPTVRFRQKLGTSNLQTLSTVAALLSAVTATTLQFSFSGLKPSTVADVVNVFWFSSLVFSVAAAVNSVFGLAWKHSMYRSPFNKVPSWVLTWIKRSPLVFLAMSIVCFSLGLCCFSYASEQNAVTSIFTTVLTAITSFGLGAVSLWFVSERWVYSRHQGRKWLADVLVEIGHDFANYPGVKWLANVFANIDDGSIRIAETSPVTKGKSPILPITNIAHAPIELSPLTHGEPARSSCQVHRPSQIERPHTIIGEPSGQTSETMTSASLPLNRLNTSPRAKELWQKVRDEFILDPATKVKRKRVPISSSLNSRVKGLVGLGAAHTLAGHTALVRHLQFSPDGEYLATSSPDRTVRILAVNVTPFDELLRLQCDPK